MTRKTKERHQQGSSSTTNGTAEAGEAGKQNNSNNGQQHKSEQQITISMSPGAQQVLEQQLKMGKGNSGGGEQMKLVAHLEMTFVGDGGDGQPKVIHRKASKQFVPAETDKSKSRSPIALHQRCGLPMPVGVGAGGEEQDTATIAHSTKTLKKQQQQMMAAGNSSGGGTGKKNSTTIAHGQLGPLSITVRACKPGGGGGSTTAGHEDSEEEAGQENNNSSGKRMGQQKAMMGNGGSGGGGGSSSAGAATGQLDMEQRNVPGEPALVKIQARKVNCKSANGEMFVVDWYLMQQSRLFKRCWDEHRQALKRKPCNGRSRKFTFSMEQVDGDTFRRVLQWLVEHDGMDEPVVREDPDTGERVWFELTEFERHFFDQPLHILNAVLTAGKYLDIPSLYLFGCQSMAALIQDKSPAEIREMLGLENDLTSADIAAIRRRNRKFKMRELKAAKYANRVQQLQSQLQQMGHPQPKNGTNTADQRGGSVQSSGLMMAEQLLMATGRDILTG